MIHLFGCLEYINFLKPILVMARHSSSGFRQGHHTFVNGCKKYNRGRGRKRTNEQYGLRSAPSARRVVLWHFFCTAFRASCRLSLGVYFSPNYYRSHAGMPTHRWPSSSLPPAANRCPLWTANSSWLVPSAVRSRLPLCVSFRQITLSGFFCQLPLSGFLCQLPLWLLLDLPFLPHFRSRRRSRVQALCLVSRQNWQRDRLLADHPHCVTFAALLIGKTRRSKNLLSQYSLQRYFCFVRNMVWKLTETANLNHKHIYKEVPVV